MAQLHVCLYRFRVNWLKDVKHRTLAGVESDSNLTKEEKEILRGIHQRNNSLNMKGPSATDLNFLEQCYGWLIEFVLYGGPLNISVCNVPDLHGIVFFYTSILLQYIFLYNVYVICSKEIGGPSLPIQPLKSKCVLHGIAVTNCACVLYLLQNLFLVLEKKDHSDLNCNYL